MKLKIYENIRVDVISQVNDDVCTVSGGSVNVDQEDFFN